MKNLMDFCIGTVVFSLLGYSLMMGEDALYGLIGLPNMDLWTNFKAFIASPADGSFTGASTFVFNLVFCATAATIVSGAMAERTKFSAYCIYSAVISLLVYPIEAHWIWGGGWLSCLGFHDYAGSCAIHMVGGIAALIGAIFLGPRLGKYDRDKQGKVVKVNAIPGHSITLGALGVFILWLGWYGFNGAAATTVSELATIFLTTTIAPSVATVVAMLYIWIRNGKPDVSMCLNASLAGLVGITAGCDAMDALGAAVVGTVSGILVVVVVELLDLKLHIDDPVGAVGVHCANGLWGTMAVGLLATPDAPAVERFGAYADPSPVAVPSVGDAPPAEAIPVKRAPSAGSGSPKFTKVEIVCREARFDALKNALMELGITGMTVSHVLGCSVQDSKPTYYRGVALETDLRPKVQVDIVVSKVPVRSVIETAKQVLYTGHLGDGKIFVYDVENVVKVRTGEEGYDALQDVE